VPDPEPTKDPFPYCPPSLFRRPLIDLSRSGFAVPGKNHVQGFGQNLLNIAILLNRNQAQSLGDLAQRAPALNRIA
jgi:hypothetical protein